ncbi:YhhA family cyclophane-containing RiPP [Pedobacter aquatilis]|uniref:YhhA family cyclophane-containing RiPP n=1 Tax=Pedobacter aquatilis TaxID=351343 RepID=UPI0025B45786|nr:YhhA family cyclophane-containing RiPP [Pedobacter aquatilis]MDN3585676.1 YhhA family cyclophane-containing RiPP [Pedobacter aquatilis]
MKPIERSSSAPVTPIEIIPVAVDASKIDNEVLKRLIAEIDFDRENHLHAYNRTHNRHNRGR